MKIAFLLLVLLVSNGYCRKKFHNSETTTTTTTAAPSPAERIAFVINELRSDVAGGVKCYKVMFNNPLFWATRTAAKIRKIATKRLRRSVMENWLERLIPFQEYIACAKFLSHNEIVMYRLMKTALKNAHKKPYNVTITYKKPKNSKGQSSSEEQQQQIQIQQEGIFRKRRSAPYNLNQDLAEVLSRQYHNSLTSMIQQLESVNSYLPRPSASRSHLSDSVQDTQRFLHNYANTFDQKTASQVFNHALNLGPEMVRNVESMDWNHLSQFQPKLGSEDVRQFEGIIARAKMAEDLMTIVDFLEKSSPGTMAPRAMPRYEGERLRENLSSSISCFRFLMKTNRFQELSRDKRLDVEDSFKKMEYLEDAVECGLYVQKYLEKQKVEMEIVLLGAVDGVIQYLLELERYLNIAEQLVLVEKKMEISKVVKMMEISKVVKMIVQFLVDDVANGDRMKMRDAFSDVQQGLNLVEKMGSDWEYQGRCNRKLALPSWRSYLPFESGSLVNGNSVGLDLSPVISKAEFAQAVINLLEAGKRMDPSHLPPHGTSRRRNGVGFYEG